MIKIKKVNSKWEVTSNGEIVGLMTKIGETLIINMVNGKVIKCFNQKTAIELVGKSL